jgi:hypothetical protein
MRRELKCGTQFTLRYLRRHSSTQRGDLGTRGRHVGFENRNPVLARLFFGLFVGQTALGLTELR